MASKDSAKDGQIASIYLQDYKVHALLLLCKIKNERKLFKLHLFLRLFGKYIKLCTASDRKMNVLLPHVHEDV